MLKEIESIFDNFLKFSKRKLIKKKVDSKIFWIITEKILEKLEKSKCGPYFIIFFQINNSELFRFSRIVHKHE